MAAVRYFVRVIKKMCCLGFYCIQNNVPEDKILNVGMPSELSLEIVDNTPILSSIVVVREDDCGTNYAHDTPVCDSLASANDDTNINAASREFKIKELFAQIDVEVEFVN